MEWSVKMRLRKLFGCIAAAFMCGMACDAAPTLAHRWSFSGDYADSVGGTLAVAIGDAISFNDSNTAVVMYGDGNGAGSLNLGTDMLPIDVPEVTVEMWATQTAVKNWARIIDYGQNDQNYFTLTWCQGTDGNLNRSEIKKANGVVFACDNTMGTYALNTTYHISVTFSVNADGSTNVRWMRRNASTGAVESSGATVAFNWTLADLASPNFYLGHSQYTPDADANAIYDEVRVWKGLLTDEQLTASVLAGPDTLPDVGTPDPTLGTVRWTGAVDDDATNAGNWSPSAPNASTLAVFSGDFAAQIPSGSTFTCAGIVFEDARLTADCDWRGLTAKIKSGTLDLAGNKLYVSQLDGEGLITEVGVPAEYQPVEYISSSGAQWINTGFTPACTDRIEIKLNFNNKTGTQCLWCSRGTTTSTSTFTSFMISGNLLRFDRNGNTNGGNKLSPTAGTLSTVVADGWTLQCTLNGADAGTMAGKGGFTPASPIVLFASHTAGANLTPSTVMGNWASYRLHSLKVYDWKGGLKCDFVPVKRVADGELGVYDRIGGTFASNMTTTPFTAGADVSDASGTTGGELHIDVPSGAASIDEGVRISGSVKIFKEGAGSFTAQAPISNTGVGKFVAGNIDVAGNKFIIDGLGGAGTVTASRGVLKNTGFDADPLASGAFLHTIPSGWTGTGDVCILKDNDDYGNRQKNGSNWCLLNSGANIRQKFTLRQAQDCKLSFNMAVRNIAGTYWYGSGNVQIDGTVVVSWDRSTDYYTATKTATVHLNPGEHTLTIAGTYQYTLIDNITLVVAGEGSVLEVNVPEGETSENLNVNITGGANMQVCKTGKGTLVMSRANSSFGAGGRRSGSVSMVVKEGIVRQTASEGTASCGAQYGTIVVRDGAQFDMRGRVYHDYDYRIAGSGPDGSGALVNTVTVSEPWAVGGSNRAYLQDVTLDGDATIGGPETWALLFYNYVNEHTMYMNGHTLTIKGVTLYSDSIAYSGAGKIVIAEDATVEFYHNAKSAPDCDIEVRGTLQQHDVALSPVKSLCFTADGSFNNPWESRPAFVVNEKYAPNVQARSGSSAQHPTVTLGAEGHLKTTLDLSFFTDVFDASTTTFYGGTEVTVELGARTFTEDTKLVSWSEMPQISGVTGVGAAIDANLVSIAMRSDGLWAILLQRDRPATARWTGLGADGDLRDPANWNCWNAYGEELPGIAPGDYTTVIVDGETSFTIPEGATMPWGRVRFGSGNPTMTQWGRIYYGSDRSGFSNTSYLDYPLNTYTMRGRGNLAGLNGGNTPWQACYLDLAQLRYDGWFYVTAAQAGAWHIRQKYDDYFGFAIDGEWVLTNPTYTVEVASDCEVAEGWHRFTIICGDTYGGQGSNGMTAGGVSVPMAISINGGTEVAFSDTVFEMGKNREVIKLKNDSDWRALGRIEISNGTVIDLNGHKLQVKDIVAGDSFVGAAVTSPFALDETVTPPDVLNGALFWLDAADASTLVVDANGNVSSWTSKTSDHRMAQASGVSPVYDTTTWGIPTVDFGDVASNKDMTYARLTTIKTVFWVIRIERSARAFLLGDKNNGSGNYNFHRGDGGRYGHSSHAKYSRIWNGMTEVDRWNDFIEEHDFEVICAQMTQNCNSDSLTYDRGTNVDSGTRNGGRQLSELICFSRDLSDDERIAVTEYLQRKWKAKAPGELHIEVPEGKSQPFNGGVTLYGNAKLVKDGAGTLTQSTVVTHVGGTEVAEGTFTMGCSMGVGRRGEVTIDEGTLFNVNSYYDFWNIEFVLNGGTMRYTGSDIGSGIAQMKHMRLTADSTLDIQNHYGFIGNGYTRSTLDLGGYTLKVNLNSGGKNFYLYNTEVRNGVLDIADGGWFETGNAGVIATDATIKCRAAVRANGAVDVRDYVAYRETSKHNEGTAAFKVRGTFTPVTDTFYGCQMQDGSTVDLSGRETAWHTTTAPDDSAKGSTTVTFADDATITVNLYGREGLFALSRAENPFVVTWNQEPENLATLKFVPDAKSKKMGFKLVPDTKMVPSEEGQVEKKGLRLVYLGGSVFFIR